MMNNFLDLLKNRRSIRKYKNQPVEAEKVETMLKAALMSPASKRTNGWEFITVDDREMLANLSRCRETGSKFLADAPVGIVVCASPDKSNVWVEDASIAALIIQLEAADLGLGSCWVQVRNREHDTTTSASDYVRSLLSIPENLEVLCIIALGYKDEERKPFDEEKLQYEKIHKGKF